MPLILATDAAAAAAALPALAGHLVRPFRADHGPPAPALPAVLLHEAGQGGGALEQALRALLPELVAVEIGSPRFARLNFDALALLAVDLSPALLDSAGGRRLFDALGGLLREGLTLLFAGEGAAMAGARLPEASPAGEDLPPLRAGLGLLPGAAVLPDLQGGVDLRALLARLSHDRVRLLALAAPAAVRCDLDGAARFTLHGAGGALLVAFVDGARPAGPGPAGGTAGGTDEAAPTARLHPLVASQATGWPA